MYKFCYGPEIYLYIQQLQDVKLMIVAGLTQCT